MRNWAAAQSLAYPRGRSFGKKSVRDLVKFAFDMRKFPQRGLLGARSRCNLAGCTFYDVVGLSCSRLTAVHWRLVAFERAIRNFAAHAIRARTRAFTDPRNSLSPPHLFCFLLPVSVPPRRRSGFAAGLAARIDSIPWLWRFRLHLSRDTTKLLPPPSHVRQLATQERARVYRYVSCAST